MTTNANFVKNVNQLINVKKTSNVVLPEIIAEPIAASQGIGDSNNLPQEASSSSLASPLKEIPNTREYYEPELIKSSDGLFVIESKAMKSAEFEDANGEKMRIEFLPT